MQPQPGTKSPAPATQPQAPINISSKFNTPEFKIKIDKESGKFMTNLDRLPLLVMNGEEISQSKTIERYVAKLCGFMGKK